MSRQNRGDGMRSVEHEEGAAKAARAREDCIAVMMAYCVTQDFRDADCFSSVFAAQGAWCKSDGESIIGREAIRRNVVDLFERHAREGIVYRHMLTSSHIVSVGDDQVEGLFYSFVYRVEGNGAVRDTSLPVALMTYDVLFEREDGVWKIARYRGINHMAAAGLRQHNA